MQLGLLTAPFPDQTLDEVASWAQSENFKALEIACWPRSDGPQRRYAGTAHIDVANLSESEAQDIAGSLQEKDQLISALGFYPNPLHPDAEVRSATISHLKHVITAAQKLDVKLVNTFVGGDASLNVDQNWEEAERVWPEIIAFARDHGITLGFENCPMLFSYDEWPAGLNIAYSPKIWRRILEAWGGDVGMNFDPSHLVWQMIDLDRFMREFGNNFVHVHAKDDEIDPDGLYENGVMSAGIAWQVPRLPGLGQVDWNVFFSRLYASDYDGPVIIEHEDKQFEGSIDKVKAGFLLARDMLQPFIR